MRRGEEPEVRELLQRDGARRSQEATEGALKRLLAGIEMGEARDSGPAYADALRKHGETLHRLGGGPLLRLVFDRLCALYPERASQRFDLLAEAWADLLSKGGQP